MTAGTSLTRDAGLSLSPPCNVASGTGHNCPPTVRHSADGSGAGLSYILSTHAVLDAGHLPSLTIDGMPGAPHILDLQLTLRDVDHPVRRTLRVSSGATLARAQRLICVCFGWNGGRSYSFEAGRLRYSARGRMGNTDDVRLRQLLPDAGAELEFEYGDLNPWFVHARVEKVFPPSDAIPTPRCLDAEGIAPPLEAGGAAAWNERSLELIEELPYEFAGATRRPYVPIRLDAINAELAQLR